MSATVVPLDPIIIAPPRSPDVLRTALASGRIGPPLCTCHAVVETALPNDVCFRTLLAQTARPREDVSEERWMRAVLAITEKRGNLDVTSRFEIPV